MTRRAPHRFRRLVRDLADRRPSSSARHHRSHHSKGGFTLMEVLVATGIFALGMVAVASIFPVAILLQRRTVQEVNATAFVENATALIEVRGFSAAVLNADTADPDYPLNDPVAATRKVPDLEVWAMPEAVTGTDGSDYEWAAVDRSFGANSSAIDREVWWVPLFFDNDSMGTTAGGTNYEANRAWRVYVFVLLRDYDATYTKPGTIEEWAIADAAPQREGEDPDNPGVAIIPGVAKISVTVAGARFNFTNNIAGDRIVRIGDEVLAEDGVTYVVIGADATGVTVSSNISGTPTAIWAAHPGDSGQSSFVDLVQLDDDDSNLLNNLIR